MCEYRVSSARADTAIKFFVPISATTSESMQMLVVMTRAGWFPFLSEADTTNGKLMDQIANMKRHTLIDGSFIITFLPFCVRGQVKGSPTPPPTPIVRKIRVK